MRAGAARLCGRCGRIRPISKKAGPGGPDICSSCWLPPAGICGACGCERPCFGVAAGRPVCTRCARRRSARACAHCGRSGPAAANWPEGPVCDACYAAALGRRGTCASCGRLRRLVAPPGPAAVTCGSCSGTGPAGHVCAGCGVEDKLYQRGFCPRCSLRRRADALLAGPDGIVPAPLSTVRNAIVAAASARGALNWLRKGAGAPVLAAIARGDLELSHLALDGWPARRPADYVRALLVAHDVLPGRDEALARLERDTASLLASVSDPDDRLTLTTYATWRVLRRARWNAGRRPAPRTVTRTARLRLRSAAALLQWLRDRSIPLPGLSQPDLDNWLLTGPPALREAAADFLGWAAARRLTPRLTLSRRQSQAGPATGEDTRWALARRLLHEPGIAPIDRIAGCFLLLYGQQLSRIAGMTRTQVRDHQTGLTVRFGRSDVGVPEPLAGFVRDQLAAPRRHHSLGAPPDTRWLFPGHLPGRPISAARLGERLGKLGIDGQAGRRAALLQLAAEVPAAVLSDLLGITAGTAADWAHAAGGDWTRYAAALVHTHAQRPGSPSAQSP
ncbi:MAG TPA: hypothetical protein VH307_20325 [Streptosporangiaceae bacterium]|nr:hypothetical protein [Streptosporangiaceae bacterium]